MGSVRPGHDGDVEGALGDLLLQDAGYALGQGDVEPRVEGAEVGEGVEERRPGQAGDGADPGLPAQQPTVLVGCGADVVEGVEHATHPGQQGLAGCGGGHAAGAALEQGEPELALEPGDLGADTGLADVQHLRGGGERAVVGDRDGVPELVNLHHHR